MVLIEEKDIKKRIFLVLGNGFDLHCGLQSTFNQFMKEKVFAERNTSYIHRLSSYFKPNPNIWYYLLTYKFYFSNSDSIFGFISDKDPKWMSVEDFIKDTLVDNGNNALLNWLKGLFKDVKDRANYLHCDAFFQKYEKDNQYKEIVAEYIIDNGEKYQSLFDLLFEDLKRFEDEFSKYLSEILDKSDYIIKAHKALDSFKEDKLYDKLYIWSFNYTNPAYNYDNCAFQRVHGELNDKENGIIIGIDQNEIKDAEKNREAFRFTKAWRKMANIGFVQSLPNKEEINEIAIYGHSLGPQDYSYFHSIFNYFDIANNKDVVVKFYYSDHAFLRDGRPDEKRNKINYDKHVDNVFKLLIDYASNSINERESKTLLTRLLLERRILIEQFYDDDSDKDVVNDDDKVSK